jgi:hypothetical protein
MEFPRGQWSGQSAWAGLYYLVDSQLPGAGTYDLEIAGCGLATIAFVAEFTGVDQSDPFAAIVSSGFGDCGSTPPSQSITVPAQGWAIDVVALWNVEAGGTQGSGQVALYEGWTSGTSLWSSYKGPLSGGNTQMSWAGSCARSAQIVGALNRGTQ